MSLDAASIGRVRAILFRYLILHRRSLVRLFEIFFWPVMDLLIWGFVVLYIQQATGGAFAQFIVFLIGAMISWDIHYRSQQALTLSLMEEVWTRNVVNILLSPLRLWEWITAAFLYGMLKVTVVTVVLAFMAYLLYAFEVIRIGWVFLPLSAALLFFGWAIGLFTGGLLLRFGHAAEALIWGIPFLIQPFSCVFYPADALPAWARGIAAALPTTYVFEGLRSVLREGTAPLSIWPPILLLNLLYFSLGIVFFLWVFRNARATGRLGHLCQD
ncbi:MAG: ABC transporter permease [Candidatus Omnitrophica bacterium]|nr:ABC transporter permease [Candidatus Omnitrophota bacterium]